MKNPKMIQDNFWAEKEGILDVVDDEGNVSPNVLSTVECGYLKISTGKLLACDPFAFMQPKDNAFIKVPCGKYKVVVTLADVSGKMDGSHIREAYATIRFKDGRGDIVYAEMSGDGGKIFTDGWDADSLKGFPVDAGTGCFGDAGNIELYMSKIDDWYNELFENENSNCWFSIMDNKDHIRDGIANITLPGAVDENIVIFHSGWGDGVYSIFAEVKNSELHAIHIDFGVV